MLTPRRQSLKTLGIALAAVGIGGAGETTLPAGASNLAALTTQLASLPRRRDFKTAPMILDNPDQWDSEALDAVLHYAGGPKQSWNTTDLKGPWLNVMRNSMNTEIWSFRHPDFLCVSATHGSAQFALYDDTIWQKYGLAKIAGVPSNTFTAVPVAADNDPANYQNPAGAFSPQANSVQALQRRGAVFLACHNAVWEHAGLLIGMDSNPDKLSGSALCAELTNHLIPGVVLTPGAVGTLAELASAGFSYAQ